MCGVFLGLQKVFDTVQHDILLSKLNNYRFKRTVWSHHYPGLVSVALGGNYQGRSYSMRQEEAMPEASSCFFFVQTRKLMTRIMIAISPQSPGFHRSHSVCNTGLLSAYLLAELRIDITFPHYSVAVLASKTGSRGRRNVPKPIHSSCLGNRSRKLVRKSPTSFSSLRFSTTFNDLSLPFRVMCVFYGL